MSAKGRPWRGPWSVSLHPAPCLRRTEGVRAWPRLLSPRPHRGSPRPCAAGRLREPSPAAPGCLARLAARSLPPAPRQQHQRACWTRSQQNFQGICMRVDTGQVLLCRVLHLVLSLARVVPMPPASSALDTARVTRSSLAWTPSTRRWHQGPGPPRHRPLQMPLASHLCF